MLAQPEVSSNLLAVNRILRDLVTLCKFFLISKFKQFLSGKGVEGNFIGGVVVVD